jgi:hypothetical protein
LPPAAAAAGLRPPFVAAAVAAAAAAAAASPAPPGMNCCSGAQVPSGSWLSGSASSGRLARLARKWRMRQLSTPAVRAWVCARVRARVCVGCGVC